MTQRQSLADQLREAFTHSRRIQFDALLDRVKLAEDVAEGYYAFRVSISKEEAQAAVTRLLDARDAYAKSREDTDA